MQSHYRILQIINQILTQDSRPPDYPCRPRELILRLMEDWSVIQHNLNILEEEELIVTQQLDTLVIRITPKGFSKVNSLDKNVVEDSGN